MCKREVRVDGARLIVHDMSPFLRQLCAASNATLAEATTMRRETDGVHRAPEES